MLRVSVPCCGVPSGRAALQPQAANLPVRGCMRARAQAEYERITSSFGMLSDWKDGIPRASYRGVVRAPSRP
jgi:hypothetical protein